MPTYEYACSACGHRLDHFQSMSDPPIKKCPKCGKLRLKKLISAGAGVIFKGSGFYTTDYRSSSYNTSKKSDVEPVAATKTDSKDAKTDSKSESKSDSKTDSKPETKVESKPESKSASPPPKKSKGKK